MTVDHGGANMGALVGGDRLDTKTQTHEAHERPEPNFWWAWLQRYGLLVVVIAGLAVVWWMGLHQYISFETLHKHHEQLNAWVLSNAWWAALLYFVVYVALVGLSLPGGALMTLAGGYLFGLFYGTLLAASGATLGATIIFIAARNASRSFIRRRAGRIIRRIEAGFRENMLSYMIFLRVVPVFPFFAINLAMAFLGVPLRLYVLTTFFGILPGSLVYAGVGNGMGHLLDVGRQPDTGVIFEPQILIPILALVILSLAPVAYREYRKRKKVM